MMDKNDIQLIGTIVSEKLTGFGTTLRGELSEKFGLIDKRFDAVDKRFDGLETRFDQLQIDIGELIENAICPQIEALDKKIDILSDKVDVIASNAVTKSTLKVLVYDYCAEYHKR